jgi:glycerol-3-phosphate dehydrogenase subunit C
VQLLSREKCCGVPLIANGFFDKARKQAQSNVAAMRENALPIIATSSTCTFTLRDEYPHLLDVDNSDLRDRVELATRWIWKQLDVAKRCRCAGCR